MFKVVLKHSRQILAAQRTDQVWQTVHLWHEEIQHVTGINKRQQTYTQFLKQSMSADLAEVHTT